VSTLILGGTGLISSAITRELLSRDVETTIFTRGRTAAFESPGVRTIRGDRFDRARFRRQFREETTFDVVIDMICFSASDAQDVVAAFAGRTEHVILCSTVEVYSPRPEAGPPATESFPREPSNPYGRGKVEAEDVLRAAETAGSFGVTVIRPAYTYGEGGTLISAFEGEYPARVRAGRPIIVPGDGRLSWVTCHRDDVAAAFVTAAGTPRAVGRAYNVTGTELMTWNDYHHSVARQLGVDIPRLVHVPLPLLEEASPTVFAPRSFIFESHYSFDTSAARDDLEFRPDTWETGLQRMLDWLEHEGRLEPPTGDTVEDLLVQAWMSGVDHFITRSRPCHA
jgi:nucleoside-diphosphate-sugar epimerase